MYEDEDLEEELNEGPTLAQMEEDISADSEYPNVSTQFDL